MVIFVCFCWLSIWSLLLLWFVFVCFYYGHCYLSLLVVGGGYCCWLLWSLFVIVVAVEIGHGSCWSLLMLFFISLVLFLVVVVGHCCCLLLYSYCFYCFIVV